MFHVIWSFFVDFRNFMHAVVVTDMRLFYVRQKYRLPGFSVLGSDLRVDAFRHDRNLFYGRCTTTKLPFYMRLMGYKYMPGQECHGRLPRGLPAGAQEFQRHHH